MKKVIIESLFTTMILLGAAIIIGGLWLCIHSLIGVFFFVFITVFLITLRDKLNT